MFASHPGLKLLDYHNISPAELVERWLPHLGDEVRLGRKQLSELAPIVELGFADSEFNRVELEEAGYRRSAVAPLMVDTVNFSSPPDQEMMDRLAVARARGGHDWLFVGQMLPHKAHQDVIKALVCARRLFDPAARLHLVGRESCPAYADALHRYVADLGLTGAVDFAGSVSSAELSAYYASADVLVCCSDHEGFSRAAARGDAPPAAGRRLRGHRRARDGAGRGDRPAVQVTGARCRGGATPAERRGLA